MDEQPTKYCSFCRSPIHWEAKICPVCRFSQGKTAFQFITDILKWMGGIAAIVSLVIGVIQLSSLVQSWSERGKAVEELVEASRLRDMANDLTAAWQLMDDALKLDPSSALARRYQVLLAMKWLRDLSFQNIEKKEVQKMSALLLPVLYRGAVTKEPELSADILAHIGTAGYIQRKERIFQVDPHLHYDLALEKDPENVYAHTMKGQWILYLENSNKPESEGKMKEALGHFSRALATGKEIQYVNKAKFDSLIDFGTIGKSNALKEANSMRLKGVSLPLDIRFRLIKIYRPLWHLGGAPKNQKDKIKSLLKALPLKELSDTYTWLNQGVDYKTISPYGFNKSDHRVILIRLKHLLEKEISS